MDYEVATCSSFGWRLGATVSRHDFALAMSAGVQVYSSDEEWDGVLAMMGQTREEQRRAWSHVQVMQDAALGCGSTEMILSSQDAEDGGDTGPDQDTCRGSADERRDQPASSHCHTYVHTDV